jgi:LigD, primase-polymerase domain
VSELPATELSRRLRELGPPPATGARGPVRSGVRYEPQHARQNAKGKTIASVYSVRPMPGAPVSTPLGWEEVNQKLNPSTYTMDAVLGRLRRHGDLFDGTTF